MGSKSKVKLSTPPSTRVRHTAGEAGPPLGRASAPDPVQLFSSAQAPYIRLATGDTGDRQSCGATEEPATKSRWGALVMTSAPLAARRFWEPLLWDSSERIRGGPLDSRRHQLREAASRPLRAAGHPTWLASTCPGTRAGGGGAGPRRRSGLSLLTPTPQPAGLASHNISYIYIVIYIIVIY